MSPEPVFEAPWHAQVFAVTVQLNDQGLFAWSEWAERFGAHLAAFGRGKELNGGDDYFTAWVATLEGLLRDKHLANEQELAEVRDAWRSAYLTTPHGNPVRIDMRLSPACVEKS